MSESRDEPAVRHGHVKSKIEDLALFGGPPAFDEELHVGRPNLGDRERFFERVRGILDARRFSNDGPMVREFESTLAAFVGAKHCVATCNGTVALQIAARAAGISGEVILPAFTFIATPHALDWIGITPVFCDIDPNSLTLDPARVEEFVTPRTGGILGVHLWGRPCNVAALEQIARRHGLKLLFDAAHALGCTLQGSRIGIFGEAEVFSFHATKICNTFEGGAIVTNDDDHAARARRLRNFGFAGNDHVVSSGTNGKMSEIAAAMGLTSLESWDEFVGANHRNMALYREELSDVPGVRLLPDAENEVSNHHYVILDVEPNSRIDRDTLQEVLRAEGILVRRYFWPGCHRCEPYRTRETNLPSRLPNTEAILGRVLSLPTGESIGPVEIRTIAGIVRLAVEQAGEISDRRSVSR